MEAAEIIVAFMMLMFCIGIVVILCAAVKELRKDDRHDIW